MRKAEAIAKQRSGDDAGFEELLKTLFRIYQTSSLENYFTLVEDLIDQARKDIESISDPREQERLRSEYRKVVNYAVDLACGY